MSAALKTPAPATRNHFPRDAALPVEGPATYAVASQPWSNAVAEWRKGIAAEQLIDYSGVSLHDLSVDHVDGAIVRGNGGLAYTRHAWQQLIALFRSRGIPRGAAEAFRWLTPGARSRAFVDVVASAMRKRGETATLRTYREPRTGHRCLRAVTSSVHSGVHFDDLALAQAFEGLLTGISNAKARIVRAADMTYGRVMLPRTGELSVGFTFRNSETGEASLGFSGSIHITALDVMLVSIDIASAGDATRRNHTLPTAGYTEAQRSAIAQGRITADVKEALHSAEELAKGWARALTQSFPAGALGSNEVMTDYMQEYNELSGELAGELLEVLNDDTRLQALPRGSAAHVAAAFGALANKAKTWGEAMRLQALAGRFALHGWKASCRGF